MWLHAIFLSLFGFTFMPSFVAARFCEGGHICSLPRECCTQGCCPPPYQSGPRQLPPPSEHVLNLFFISHWFFWCVVVAIILAILCAYSLWKKRRTLCGWGFPEHHAQSEGDSAGSCYAPPQYSRCNSFHHPPPPYTEVTSKPDLYPLVFTCNSDNGKNGSSYLMVQYFRNYIVRPAGSLSAASTVDSLSSSFICNANEANTLVPPPYSRAASPEIGFSSHFQHHQQSQQQHHHPHHQYMLPRSASQLVCTNGAQSGGGGGGGGGGCGGGDLGGLAAQQVYQEHRTPHYKVVALNGAVGSSALVTPSYGAQLNASESGNLQLEDIVSGGSGSASISVNGVNGVERRTRAFGQSQSDQHFRYMATSSSSISDIFVNNSCSAATVAGAVDGGSIDGVAAAVSVDLVTSSPTGGGGGAFGTHPQSGGTPVIFSNGCIKPNPLHRASTTPTQFAEISHRVDPVYNSCNNIEGISIAVSVAAAASATASAAASTTAMAATEHPNAAEFRDLHMLRRSLETCCQLLQQLPASAAGGGGSSGGSGGSAFATGDSPLRMPELVKKYAEEGVRSYVTSGTCSAVSSLANIGTPSSPPQATSPTGEVKDILDQIRQLQAGVSYEDILCTTNTRPTLHHTMSSPSPSPSPSVTCPRVPTTAAAGTASAGAAVIVANKPTSSGFSAVAAATSKRPSTLQQTKRKFYTPKPNKAMYTPMTANPAPASRCILKSPVSSVVGANFFTNRSRVRKAWISRSAPTTPGTGLPPNRLGDDSPLLNEHDEDPEGEQNAEME